MDRPVIPARAAAGLLLALAVVGLGRPGWAQTDQCDQLRQAIAAVAQPDPQRAAQFTRAAQRQRTELARTQAYSDQIGCSHGFSIFGNGDPPQCDTIQAQIDRMNGNLSALEQQINQLRSGDPERQAGLEEQYRATCGLQASGQPQDGAVGDAMQPDDMGAEPSQEGGSRRYGKAVCVRTCDGGYFPLSFAPAQHDDAGLQNLCSALCPNAEVKLYTTPDYDNISAAVALDGSPYANLPNALRYQKTFDPTCACKPPGKSWVQALAAAEQLLEKSGGNDVTVTEKMSEEMARPVVANAPLATPVKKKGFSKAQIKALLDAQAAAEGALGAVGKEAPTASTESAGIARDAGTQSDHLVRTGEGSVQSVPGPGGANRRVRIIGPAL